MFFSPNISSSLSLNTFLKSTTSFSALLNNGDKNSYCVPYPICIATAKYSLKRNLSSFSLGTSTFIPSTTS